MNRDVLVPIVVALIGAGLLSYLRGFINWARQRASESTPQRRRRRQINEHIASADQSLLTVARARDELEADNDRLRQAIADNDARHERERAEWTRERAELRAEIDGLERRLRTLLDELVALKTRHGIAGG